MNLGTTDNIHDIVLFVIFGIFVIFILDVAFKAGIKFSKLSVN